MGIRLIALGAGALALALVTVGCGGGNSSDGPTIAKAAFIKKADAICSGGNKRMEIAFAHFLEKNQNVKNPSDSDYEELVGKVLIPNVSREIREIQALGAPSGDEDRVDDIIGALEEGVETAERVPHVVVNSSEAVFGISSRLAKEYGLEVCGSR